METEENKELSQNNNLESAFGIDSAMDQNPPQSSKGNEAKDATKKETIVGSESEGQISEKIMKAADGITTEKDFEKEESAEAENAKEPVQGSFSKEEVVNLIKKNRKLEKENKALKKRLGE